MQSDNKPSEEYNKCWIFAKSKDIKLDMSKIGKWMLFVYKVKIDEFWSNITKLYNDGKLEGIYNMKVSTRKMNPRSNSNINHVICCYCGPYDDKDAIMKIGTNLVKVTGYNMAKKIYYKSDVQTKLGTRKTRRQKNHLYELEVINTSNMKYIVNLSWEDKRKILFEYCDLYKQMPKFQEVYKNITFDKWLTAQKKKIENGVKDIYNKLAENLIVKNFLDNKK